MCQQLPVAKFQLLVTSFMGSHHGDSHSNNSLTSGLQLWRCDLEPLAFK